MFLQKTGSRKQPQLTPAKNVVDATALFNGRPDTDPENVAVYIGFTQDWTIDPRLRPPVGVPAFAHVGLVSINMESVPKPIRDRQARARLALRH